MVTQKHIIVLCFLTSSFLYGAQTAQPTLSNNTRQVHRGQIFTIALQSNPTTGYSWQTSGYDKKYIKLIDHTYEKKPTNTKLVGSGGTEYWKFKALKRGDTRVSLEYKRSWEKNIPAAKQYQLHLTIK